MQPLDMPGTGTGFVMDLHILTLNGNVPDLVHELSAALCYPADGSFACGMVSTLDLVSVTDWRMLLLLRKGPQSQAWGQAASTLVRLTAQVVFCRCLSSHLSRIRPSSAVSVVPLALSQICPLLARFGPLPSRIPAAHHTWLPVAIHSCLCGFERQLTATKRKGHRTIIPDICPLNSSFHEWQSLKLPRSLLHA